AGRCRPSLRELPDRGAQQLKLFGCKIALIPETGSDMAHAAVECNRAFYRGRRTCNTSTSSERDFHQRLLAGPAVGQNSLNRRTWIVSSSRPSRVSRVGAEGLCRNGQFPPQITQLSLPLTVQGTRL